MPKFELSVEIAAPIEKVFEFHLTPHNLMTIAPPASRTVTESCTSETLQVGTRVVVRSVQAGIPIRIEAEVTEMEAPRLLRDRQVSGPFSRWIHTHRFETVAEGTRLTDEVDYALPLGALGGFVMGHTVARELQETFAYRQEQTKRILETGS